MASLQTTIVYLSRSVYAMGRDGVLPGGLGRLDRRETPTASIIAVAAVVLAFTLATGFSKSARDAYAIVLSGSAVFLGALFMLSTAAAVRMTRTLLVPLLATVSLGSIIVVAVVQSDIPTRIFIVGGALVGLPLALWRSRRTLPREVGTIGAGPESATPAVHEAG